MAGSIKHTGKLVFAVALAVLLLGACVAVSQAYAATSLTTTADHVAATQASSEAAAKKVNTGKGDLAPGTYYLASAFKSSTVATIVGKKSKNGSNAELGTVTGAKLQQWLVTVDKKGYARLKNAKTGKVLTVDGEKAKKGTNVVQWKSSSKKYLAQRWIIKQHGSRYVILSALNKKYAVSVSGKKTAESNNMALKKRTNSRRQQFSFVPKDLTPAVAGEQTVQNGTYLLCPVVAPKRPVSIEEASKKSGANAIIWSAFGSPSQAFKVIYDGAGFYTLTNVNSKKKLAVNVACGVSGINVGQYSFGAVNRAKWRIEPLGKGYRLVNKATGLALDVEGGKNANATNVRLCSPGKADSQVFAFKTLNSINPSPLGTYYLSMSSAQNRVIGMKDDDRTEDARTNIQKKKNKNLQRFKIQSAGKGLFYLKNAATGRMMTIVDAKNKKGSNVIMCESTEKTDQKWRVVFNDDFTVSFVNAASGLALNVSGGKTAVGTKVNTRKFVGSKGQKFSLLSTAKQQEKVVLDVPCYMQNPQLPTGCESVAVTNALRYWGFKLGKTTIASRWMPRGSNGVTNFIGNPYNSSGWIICAPGIEITANRYLDTKDTYVTATNVSGTSLKGLRKYLDKGYPVVVWTTMYMGSPWNYSGSRSYDGHRYPLYHNNHAVVLIGYNPKTGRYRVADSLSGKVWRSGGSFKSIYNTMGKQAVVLADAAV